MEPGSVITAELIAKSTLGRHTYLMLSALFDVVLVDSSDGRELSKMFMIPAGVNYGSLSGSVSAWT